MTFKNIFVMGSLLLSSLLTGVSFAFAEVQMNCTWNPDIMPPRGSDFTRPVAASDDLTRGCPNRVMVAIGKDYLSVYNLSSMQKGVCSYGVSSYAIRDQIHCEQKK